VHEGAEFPEWKSELFSVHWIGKIKVFWYDDFARRLNFSVLELQIMNIFDHLRKAANEIAQQAAARISNLDRQIAEIEEQKKKIETDRTKARGSLQRAANFPVKNGADYLCPSCWVDEGKMTPLNPIPSQTSDDIFICPLCSYETIIQQQR
jgi:aspartate/methionine/tyrosine aminotransferase